MPRNSLRDDEQIRSIAEEMIRGRVRIADTVHLTNSHSTPRCECWTCTTTYHECNTCHRDLPRNEFYCRDGMPYDNRCRNCNREYVRTRRALRRVAVDELDLTVSDAIDNRLFGVEIEFIRGDGVRPAHVVRALRSAGIQTQDESDTHRGNSRTDWVLKYDGSLPSGGSELVSPPLRGQDGLRQLKLALKVLRDLGSCINSACGLHIHHDAENLSLEAIKQTVRTYVDNQRNIDQMVSRSRRSDMGHTYCTEIGRDMMRDIESADSLSELRRRAQYWDRYHVVNLAAYAAHGTLEFRQHQGSLNYAKIEAWILFGQAIVREGIRKAAEGTPQIGLAEWLRSLPGMADATVQHLAARAEGAVA